MKVTAKERIVKKLHHAPRVLAVLAVSTLFATGCTPMSRPVVTPADAGVIEALKRKLTRDGRFSRLTDVSVDPATGVVKLEGEVSSKADRADAGRLASSVPGVAVVYNEIRVHSSPR